MYSKIVAENITTIEIKHYNPLALSAMLLILINNGYPQACDKALGYTLLPLVPFFIALERYPAQTIGISLIIFGLLCHLIKAESVPKRVKKDTQVRYPKGIKMVRVVDTTEIRGKIGNKPKILSYLKNIKDDPKKDNRTKN